MNKEIHNLFDRQFRAVLSPLY